MSIHGGWDTNSDHDISIQTISFLSMRWFFHLTYAIIALQLSTKCDSKETRARCDPNRWKRASQRCISSNPRLSLKKCETAQASTERRIRPPERPDNRRELLSNLIVVSQFGDLGFVVYAKGTLVINRESY